MNDDMAMPMPMPMSLEQVVTNQPPPDLEEWRRRLFMVEGTIVMSEDEYVNPPTFNCCCDEAVNIITYM